MGWPEPEPKDIRVIPLHMQIEIDKYSAELVVTGHADLTRSALSDPDVKVVITSLEMGDLSSWDYRTKTHRRASDLEVTEKLLRRLAEAVTMSTKLKEL